EASADVEPGGVDLRGGAAADGGGQAVQEGWERDGGDLEDAAHRREDVPTPRRAGIARRRREWSHVRQRSSRSEPTHRGRRRLISFTHFLTRPRGVAVRATSPTDGAGLAAAKHQRHAEQARHVTLVAGEIFVFGLIVVSHPARLGAGVEGAKEGGSERTTLEAQHQEGTPPSHAPCPGSRYLKSWRSGIQRRGRQCYGAW